MKSNDELLEELKEGVTKRSANKNFIHYYWFIEYHVEIVEKIASELCDIYEHADRFKVLVLAWIHDYEKIIDFDNQYNTELIATRELMEQVGFNKDFISGLLSDLNILNAKKNLQETSIEIQIVSSADGASHFVGPFGSLYWYENPSIPMADIQTERFRKIGVDWEQKITLPEVKKAFKGRYLYGKEATGELPQSYLG